jgi:hypothetical protein
VLNPGGSVYESLVLTGRNGWDIAEPGRYTIQAAMEINGEPIFSAPLHAPTAAVESFGHVQAKRYYDRYHDWLATEGDPQEAAAAQGVPHDTMAKRDVRDRKVLTPVLNDIKDRQERFEDAAPKKRKR